MHDILYSMFVTQKQLDLETETQMTCRQGVNVT